MLLCLTAPLWAIIHPSIYVSDLDKRVVKEKIEASDWAKEAFVQLKKKVDPYVERHQKDSEWIVSRLAMYWKEGAHHAVLSKILFMGISISTRLHN